MWVIHAPGSCNDKAKTKDLQKPLSKNETLPTTIKDKTQIFAAVLKEQGATDDEIQSKLEAIVAVLES